MIRRYSTPESCDDRGAVAGPLPGDDVSALEIAWSDRISRQAEGNVGPNATERELLTERQRLIAEDVDRRFGVGA